jgi:disulfide bond formation protein DsbB
MVACGAGSAALLAGALGFQFIGGLAPCPLCIWQRWPHVAAVAIAVLGVAVLWRHWRGLAVLGSLAMLISAGLGMYHTGIERGWWQGPDSCTLESVGGLATEDLMAQILNAPLVRCDEVAWDFLGLSMASWNAVISVGLAALWLALAVRAPKPHDSSSASQ